MSHIYIGAIYTSGTYYLYVHMSHLNCVDVVIVYIRVHTTAAQHLQDHKSRILYTQRCTDSDVIDTI